MSKPKKAPSKKKINGYKMPEPLPAGEILLDSMKNQWMLGPSIGKGGFGEIYSAKQADNKANDYLYVVKIEPHENGPLFVEMHFYTRNARESDVDKFKEEKDLEHLGMPIYIGSGSHLYQAEKYRFIVMQKFAPKDVWKLFVENSRKLPPITAYQLSLQVLDVLEYIHSKGYIHGDVKGANILLSEKDPNNAYLVDFGLAAKYTCDDKFVPNPKKMHNGTIEYLSRDAHQGVQTRRGDIEILAYNLIHWLTGKLPWEGTSDPKVVQQSKETYMENPNKLVSECFGTNIPDSVQEILKFVNTLSYNEAPDYVQLKEILVKGLKDAGGTERSPLVFSSAQKRKSAEHDDEVPKKRGKAALRKEPRAKAKPRTKVRKDDSDHSEAGKDENSEPTATKTDEMLRIEALLEKKKPRRRQMRALAANASPRPNQIIKEDVNVRRSPRCASGKRLNYNEEMLASGAYNAVE